LIDGEKEFKVVFCHISEKLASTRSSEEEEEEDLFAK